MSVRIVFGVGLAVLLVSISSTTAQTEAGRVRPRLLRLFPLAPVKFAAPQWVACFGTQ
jgi:hypothetical protein